MTRGRRSNSDFGSGGFHAKSLISIFVKSIIQELFVNSPMFIKRMTTRATKIGRISQNLIFLFLVCSKASCDDRKGETHPLQGASRSCACLGGPNSRTVIQSRCRSRKLGAQWGLASTRRFRLYFNHLPIYIEGLRHHNLSSGGSFEL